jgi:hypothetical protein
MSAPTEFDLQPDPRILPMLGEINLAQWRCLAELVDNGVDGFLSLIRAGQAPSDPEISVNLPMKDDASARVTVSDNGPGMAPDRLERAVRAGWSGNNPVDSLGMFGMGFNIATARLGTVTTVWTSRKGEAEEHGLRVDFDELRKQGHFRTPRLTRTKTDPNMSGTSITIERLKPDQRAWLAKPGNRAAVKQELAKAYSSMLRPNGVPAFRCRSSWSSMAKGFRRSTTAYGTRRALLRPAVMGRCLRCRRSIGVYLIVHSAPRAGSGWPRRTRFVRRAARPRTLYSASVMCTVGSASRGT